MGNDCVCECVHAWLNDFIGVCVHAWVHNCVRKYLCILYVYEIEMYTCM